MKHYLRILGFLKPQLPLVGVIMLLSLVYIFFNSITLWISANFINILFDPQANAAPPTGGIPDAASLNAKLNAAVETLIARDTPYDTLVMVCLVLLACFLLKNIVSYAKKILIAIFELRIITNLRVQIYAHVNQLSMKYFDKTKTGDITAISINDVEVINSMLRSSFDKMIMTPIEILTFMGLLFIISWELAAFTLIIMPIIAVLVVQIGSSIRRRSKRIFEQVAEVLNLLQERIGAASIVKAFAMEKQEVERYTGENQKYFRLSMKRRRLSELTSPLNEIIGASMAIFLLWYGGKEVLSGQGMVAEDFIRFIVVLFAMFAPLRTLSGLNNILQAGMAAGERIFAVLDTKPDIKDKPGAIEIEGFEREIVLEKVGFHYDDPNQPVLTDINLSIRKGEIVAFVGHSGAGKTTLVNLIPRFYEVDSGRITIDGKDIRDVTQRSLRLQMGIVTQESILFNDTIRANIGYGLFDVSDQRIIEAARVANAWEFIEQLPNGLDTVIGERGVRLSGGQRQRLSIARAVLRNPPILILDEATSALDTESEKLVQDALTKLMQHRTVLVIAHRLSTVINADKIIVMDKGRVVESGKHTELLARGGIYKHLYSLQFEAEEQALRQAGS